MYIYIYIYNYNRDGEYFYYSEFHIIITCSTLQNFRSYIRGSLAYWTTSILLETFFVQFRIALEIHLESYGSRQASVFLQYNIVHAYTASLYIHRYLVRNYTWQQNSRTLWMHTCTTHQTAALLPTMHRLIRTKLASCTTRCNFN